MSDDKRLKLVDAIIKTVRENGEGMNVREFSDAMSASVVGQFAAIAEVEHNPLLVVAFMREFINTITVAASGALVELAKIAAAGAEVPQGRPN
jgi:hypothetical protein